MRSDVRHIEGCGVQNRSAVSIQFPAGTILNPARTEQPN
jgi:hypothetical protein